MFYCDILLQTPTPKPTRNTPIPSATTPSASTLAYPLTPEHPESKSSLWAEPAPLPSFLSSSDSTPSVVIIADSLQESQTLTVSVPINVSLWSEPAPIPSDYVSNSSPWAEPAPIPSDYISSDTPHISLDPTTPDSNHPDSNPTDTPTIGPHICGHHHQHRQPITPLNPSYPNLTLSPIPLIFDIMNETMCL